MRKCTLELRDDGGQATDLSQRGLEVAFTHFSRRQTPAPAAARLSLEISSHQLGQGEIVRRRLWQ